MAYKTNRQIKVTRIPNIIPVQVTSQEMVSRVGKAYSAPLQPPHVEALRPDQQYFFSWMLCALTICQIIPEHG
jgi:hypothetical protein